MRAWEGKEKEIKKRINQFNYSSSLSLDRMFGAHASPVYIFLPFPGELRESQVICRNEIKCCRRVSGVKCSKRNKLLSNKDS